MALAAPPPAADPAPPPAATWRFPRAFWTANVIELFERAAYYGVFISLALFLSSVVGFTDVEAGWIGACFSAAIYFLPFVTGEVADRVGYRPALASAFALLSTGYAALALLPRPAPVLGSLGLIAVGGAFVKAVIAGTVARTSDAHNRARAYSLFYMMVNIGSFSGKTIAKPVRAALGVGAVPLYSAGAAFLALLVVILFYRPEREVAPAGPAASKPSLATMAAALKSGRFVALILITAGFWMIQGQLYASMPKYVLRTVGDGASPEWYANVNPFMVVLCVVPITQLMRGRAAVTSIGVALAMIPLSALLMALSPHLGRSMTLLGAPLHPVTLMMVLGIALQGLAECFLAPRYLEYASKLAPPGREALYLGYAHLNTFVAWFIGFVASGYLLERFCPDPARQTPALRAAHKAAIASGAPLPALWEHAHYLWFFFVGVGALAFLALLVFQRVTAAEDERGRS